MWRKASCAIKGEAALHHCWDIEATTRAQNNVFLSNNDPACSGPTIAYKYSCSLICCCLLVGCPVHKAIKSIQTRLAQSSGFTSAPGQPRLEASFYVDKKRQVLGKTVFLPTKYHRLSQTYTLLQQNNGHFQLAGCLYPEKPGHHAGNISRASVCLFLQHPTNFCLGNTPCRQRVLKAARCRSGRCRRPWPH